MERIEKLEETITDLSSRLQKIEITSISSKERCDIISNTLTDCCGSSALKEKIVAHNDLKKLIEQMKEYTLMFSQYEDRLRMHEKYFLIGVGVLMTLEFMGVGGTIRKMIIEGI